MLMILFVCKSFPKYIFWIFCQCDILIIFASKYLLLWNTKITF